MSLSDKTIANSYKDVLQIDNSNSGMGTSTKTIKSGNGTSSAVQISDDQFQVIPQNDDTTATFTVLSKGGTSLLNVDSTNSTVKANGNHLNSQVQRFLLSHVTAKPSVTDTWTSLWISGGRTPATAPITGGTGSSPSTSFSITTDAFDYVATYFYLPIDITIDKVQVLFASDADTGDTVKFSIMAYDVDIANGSTCGNLSNGAEICVSPSALATDGQEQMRYQQLTVSTANVDAGKVIVAFVSQDGTNSDLGVNMHMLYHYR